jgi:tRNA pseudouridine38-40 synthase
MQRAAQCLLGERDFSSFRAAECQSSTPMRRLIDIAVERRGDVVEITVRANAFLHHMVRNIAGSLLLVGGGDRPEAWLAEVAAARDRTRAGPTAPPQGLYFAGVEYPASFGLPCAPRGSGRLDAGPSGDPP